MNCLNCGAKLSPKSNRCTACDYIALCPKCGEILPPDAKSCNACGELLPVEEVETRGDNEDEFRLSSNLHSMGDVINGYCVDCGANMEMKDAKAVTKDTKHGPVNFMVGTCLVCGATMWKVVSGGSKMDNVHLEKVTIAMRDAGLNIFRIFKREYRRYWIPALIGVALFGWYEVRPAIISANCNKFAINKLAGEATYSRTDAAYEEFYKFCLRENGIVR